MFNPEEYSLNKDNNFASQAIPGPELPAAAVRPRQSAHARHGAVLRHVRESTATCANETKKIVDLLRIDSELHAPPVLQVVWGSLFFRCVLSKARPEVHQVPERRSAGACARLTVTFQEYLDAETQSKEANLQTVDFSKVPRREREETLQRHRESLLRHRAQRGGRIARRSARRSAVHSSGQAIRVPALPFVDPDSGEVIA